MYGKPYHHSDKAVDPPPAPKPDKPREYVPPSPKPVAKNHVICNMSGVALLSFVVVGAVIGLTYDDKPRIPQGQLPQLPPGFVEAKIGITTSMTESELMNDKLWQLSMSEALASVSGLPIANITFASVAPTAVTQRRLQISQCASNYGTSDICCGQSGTPSPPQYQCPKEFPICQNYVYDENWGQCSSSGGRKEMCMLPCSTGSCTNAYVGTSNADECNEISESMNCGACKSAADSNTILDPLVGSFGNTLVTAGAAKETGLVTLCPGGASLPACGKRPNLEVTFVLTTEQKEEVANALVAILRTVPLKTIASFVGKAVLDVMKMSYVHYSPIYTIDALRHIFCDTLHTTNICLRSHLFLYSALESFMDPH